MVKQECCNGDYAVLIGHIFTKRCEVIRKWPSSTPRAITSWKLRSKNRETKTFFSVISLHVANLCFSLSALRIFASRLWRFPVLMTGSCYPSYFATESALYRLSDECSIRGAGTSNSFWSYCTVEITLDVFHWTCVLRETQIYRMLSSYVLRAIRLVSGFAVAIWTNWMWNYSQSKLSGSINCIKQRCWIVIDCYWIDCGYFT